jgi:hypothetical protein
VRARHDPVLYRGHSRPIEVEPPLPVP